MAGEEEKFLALSEELIEASRAEAGCIEYGLHKDVNKKSTYCMLRKVERSGSYRYTQQQQTFYHYCSATCKYGRRRS